MSASVSQIPRSQIPNPKSRIPAPTRLLIAALLLALLLAPCAAHAQSIDNARLPRAFVGGGVAPATNDGDSRMRLNDGSSFIWLVEGGARVAPRIGIGAEFAQPADVTASTAGRSFNASGRQAERILIGLARSRAWGSDRVAIDVVGGAGVLFQHHELRVAPCFSGCAITQQQVLDRRAPAFSFGADAPVRIGRHFGINGLARFYVLRRGDHTTELPVSIPWQFEYTSSTRLAVGVTGRARW